MVRIRVEAACSGLDDNGIELAFKKELSGLPGEVFCELMDHVHDLDKDLR